MTDDEDLDSDTFFAQRDLENLLELFNANPKPERCLTFKIYELCRSFDFQIPSQVMDKLLCMLDGYARRHREDNPVKFTHPGDCFPEYMLVRKLTFWGCKQKQKPPGVWKDYFRGIPLKNLEDFFDKPSQEAAIDLVAAFVAKKDPSDFRRLFYKWKQNR